MSVYIKQLKLFNFAAVRELVVSFSEGINYLVGINGSGKSTVVNGLWAGLKGIVSKGKPGALIAERYQMIGDFAKTAKNEILLHDTKTGRDILIKTKITKDGNQIEAIDLNGTHMPEGYINKLFNLMCIDPTSFCNMPGGEQALALGINTSEFDMVVKILKAERTDVTREVNRLKNVVEAWGDLKEVEPVDTVELVVKKDETVAFNNEQVDRMDELTPDGLEEFINGFNSLDNGDWYNLDFEQRKIELTNHLKSLIPPEAHKSTEEIDEQIANADQTNRDANDYQTFFNDLAALESQVKLEAEKNKQIDKTVLDRDNYIKAAKLPFPNMSVDENGGLLVDGKPFKEPYFSTGEIWSMSSKLLAALNPEMKVIIVRAANNLDEDKLKAIEDLSKPVMSKDGKKVVREPYQIIFEFVGKKPVKDRHTILLRECEIVESYDEPSEKQETL